MWRYLLPLAVFVVMVIFLSVGLKLDPREVPSPLIGKPAPDFNLPKLNTPNEFIKPADFKGKVWLFNVWASWCVSCRAEHPVLNALVKDKSIILVGLNYKDESKDALFWLKQRGNPYLASAFDLDGRVGINWGVYGVPETFVIDKKGLIRYKHTGPVDINSIQQTILPLVRKLETEKI